MRASVLGAVLLLYACGSSKSTAAPADQAREDLITEACALAAPCCGAASTKCSAQLHASLPTPLDPTSVQTCIAALKTISADPNGHFCAGGGLLTAVPACMTLQARGTVPVGGTCKDDVAGHDCAQAAGTHVACISGTDDTELCVLLAPGKLGDLCLGDMTADGAFPAGYSINGAVLSNASFCDRSAGFYCNDEQHCVAINALHADCTEPTSCVAGAYCPFADPPTCLATVPDGTACLSDDQCQSGNCDLTSHACSDGASGAFQVAYCDPN